MQTAALRTLNVLVVFAALMTAAVTVGGGVLLAHQNAKRRRREIEIDRIDRELARARAQAFVRPWFYADGTTRVGLSASIPF